MKPLTQPQTILAAAFLSLFGAVSTQAQGTAFTYQGRLDQSGSPVTGLYDVRFNLYGGAGGGSAVTGAIEFTAQPVTNGLFTVTLDFGNQFPGVDRWLEIAARTNGAPTFNTLAPRQKLAATPYAITAGSLTGAVPGSGLVGTYNNPVTLNNAANNFTGSFAGNGAGVSNVNAATLNGLTSANFWKTNGNAGANPTNGAFVGTTDNFPLEVKVNGQRALRLEPNATSPNVIGGSTANRVDPTLVGGTIAGGGNALTPNRVTASYATVLGGSDNIASGTNSIAGGGASRASGGFSTALGRNTTASGGSATALGEFTVAEGNFSAALNYGTRALGTHSTAMGWGSEAAGNFSLASGYATKTAGERTFAAGTLAYATNEGSFVWADASLGTAPANAFGTTGTNQFLIRAQGGVGINTNRPQAALHVAGNYLRVDGGANEQAVIGGDGFGGDVEIGSANPNIGRVALFNQGSGTYMDLFARSAAFSGIISGDGSGLVNLPASQLSGSILDAQLSANVALRSGGNTFFDDQIVNGTVRAFNDTVEAFEVGGLAGGYSLLDRFTGAANRWSVYAQGGALGFYSVVGGDHMFITPNGVFVPRTVTAGAVNTPTNNVGVLVVTNSVRVPGAGIGTSTPAFVHRATAANIEVGASHRTTIDHPLCNGDANAILIITHNYNPGNTGFVTDTHQASVYFNPNLNKWQIYHDDLVALSVNSAWNVLVIKP